MFEMIREKKKREKNFMVEVKRKKNDMENDNINDRNDIYV